MCINLNSVTVKINFVTSTCHNMVRILVIIHQTFNRHKQMILCIKCVKSNRGGGRGFKHLQLIKILLRILGNKTSMHLQAIGYWVFSWHLLLRL